MEGDLSEYYDLYDCLLQLQQAEAELADGNYNKTNRVAGNNSTSNVSYVVCDVAMWAPDSAEFNILRTPLCAILVIILYVIIVVLGTVGNTLVVITVLKTRQLWNATNVFISNLAVADIFVCSFALPLSAYYQLTDVWIFGKALCHVIPAAFAVVVFTSTLTLTLIAVDRFILIVYPLKTKMSVSVALALVLAVAVVSTAAASPIAIFADYVVMVDEDIKLYKRYCTEDWPKKAHRKIYTVLALILQYFLPLVIIAILYLLIFRQINTRMRRPTRKTKTTKVMVAVVTVFAFAWTPFHLFSLITEFHPGLVRGKYYRLVDMLLRVLAMSSSCLNPFLYGWLNDNYRNAFISLIKKPSRPATRVFREESEVSQKSVFLQSLREASVGYKDSILGKLRKARKGVQPGDIELARQQANNNTAVHNRHVTTPLVQEGDRESEIGEVGAEEIVDEEKCVTVVCVNDETPSENPFVTIL